MNRCLSVLAVSLWIGGIGCGGMESGYQESNPFEGKAEKPSPVDRGEDLIVGSEYCESLELSLGEMFDRLEEHLDAGQKPVPWKELMAALVDLTRQRDEEDPQKWDYDARQVLRDLIVLPLLMQEEVQDQPLQVIRCSSLRFAEAINRDGGKAFVERVFDKEIRVQGDEPCPRGDCREVTNKELWAEAVAAADEFTQATYEDYDVTKEAFEATCQPNLINEWDILYFKYLTRNSVEFWPEGEMRIWADLTAECTAEDLIEDQLTEECTTDGCFSEDCSVEECL